VVGNFLRRRLPSPLGIKVPEITLSFWVIKILSTGMGEDASDFLVRQFGKGPAVISGLLVLGIGLYLQLRIRTYNKWVYWFAVVMVSVFGTMAADVLHLGLGIPYAASTFFFLGALILIFWLWHKVEGTLSIDSISTERRELFYWATVMTTFALGTAAGDMTAHTFKWGFLNSGIIFGLAFLVPGASYLAFKFSPVLAFWISYVITRPFGASFADWFGADKLKGGRGFGFGSTSLILTGAIVIVVALSARRTPGIESGRSSNFEHGE
jgi:uncharacterized membrane-anchored protein